MAPTRLTWPLGGWGGQFPAGGGGGDGAWPVAAVASPRVAAPTPVENTDEVEELELEKINNQRMDEWVRLQSRIHLSTDERRAFLRAMALQFTQGNGVDANNLLLGCISNSEPVLRASVRAFGNVGGRITSAYDTGCQYGGNHLTLAMSEVARAWDIHNGHIFARVRSEFVNGESVWGVAACCEFDDEQSSCWGSAAGITTRRWHPSSTLRACTAC